MLESEVEPQAALEEISRSLPLLLDASSASRIDTGIRCSRSWHAPAATYTYHTTAVVEEADAALLEKVSSIFLHGNDLDHQPWYAQFRSGFSERADLPLPPTIHDAFLGQARFDFGLGKDRYYNQLIAEHRPNANTRVIAIRSVAGLPAISDAVLAHTLSPSADVFELHGDRLWWHHIVTVGGAALLPSGLDRVFMNTLRFLRLDRREQRTYLDEAKGFIAFCRSAELDELARQVASTSPTR